MRNEPKTSFTVDASFHTAGQNAVVRESLEKHMAMLKAHEEWADTVEPTKQLQNPPLELKL